jgi:glycosyltransferase involved in cell wall biosynthesis
MVGLPAYAQSPHHRNGSGFPPVVVDVRVVSGAGGGPEKTILNSPRFLRRAGYRMLCAYLYPPNDPGFATIRAKALRRRAPLIAIPDYGPLSYQCIRRLVKLCREHQVSIWHGHDYKSNALGLLVKRFWPMHLITTVHGWVHHSLRTPLYYAIDRLCLRHYERVLCVSDDLVRRCRRAGVRAQRCELLENGIDLEEHQRRYDVASAKRALGLDPNQLLIGAVGRLSAEKGFDLLIQALTGLDGLDRPAALAIIGDGHDRGALEARAKDVGCGDRVLFTGFLPDPAPWYEAMDVFALSSLREGLPNVLLEAMAYEVPVVATRVGGVPRLVLPEQTGLLIEPGSTNALADALRRLLQDASLRQRLGQAGRALIEKNHSFAVRMAKIRAIYDNLLTRRQGLKPLQQRNGCQ